MVNRLARDRVLQLFGLNMNLPEPPFPAREPRYCLTTREFAAQYRAKEQSVRKQHAANGAYCGVRPLILPNKRLLWPDRTIEDLAAQKLGDGGLA